MPQLFQVDDPRFFESGPESLEWIRVGTEATGSRMANFVMADDPEDPEAPIASMLFLPPGHTLPRHSHDCYRAEIIIRGSLRVGDTVLHDGDVSLSKPNEAYGPHVAGPTGCLSVEIFSRGGGLLPAFEGELDDEAKENMERFTAAVERFNRNHPAS
jgi:anti-sigma factor ChrR (cupin superfamily)